MAIDFLDILMEAKNKRPIKISPTDDEKTDYTEEPDDEATDEEEEDTAEDDEAEPADYTDSDEEEAEVDEEDNEEPTDYTESEEEMGDDEEETDESDEDMGEDEEPTDYTDSEDEPSDYTDDEGSDEPADDAGDGEAQDMEEEEGPTDDEKKNKSLLEDLIRLKEIVGNFIDKTSSINGNDISNVKIINQLTNNLGQLSKQIHNYIIYRFSNETYVRNLYFYNYSVEALNISINMLKKINSFKHNK